MPGISKEEATKILEKFEKEYVSAHGPLASYFHSCGMSRVDILDDAAPEDERKDFCISIGLREELPLGLAFPDRYEGLRVYARLMEPAVPFDD